MNSRFFHIIFGIVLSFVSMLNGMASTGRSGEVQANVSEICAVEENTPKQTTVLLDEFGLTAEFLGAEQAEFSFGGEQEETSNQAKRFSKLGISSKCRLHDSLSDVKASKGAASNSRTLDALQELTATIRFLQLEALV